MLALAIEDGALQSLVSHTGMERRASGAMKSETHSVVLDAEGADRSAK